MTNIVINEPPELKVEVQSNEPLQITVTESEPSVITVSDGTSLSVGAISNFVYNNIQSSSYIHTFSWGDASPIPILTLKATQALVSVTVCIQQAFDTMSEILLGVSSDPDLFFNVDQGLATVAQSYMSYPFYLATQATDILLTINPGSGNSTGQGFIILSLAEQ